MCIRDRLIEPKPCEPTKHQYDRDVSTVIAFLEKYGLLDSIKLNIEANHATLAGLSFEHEVANAIAYGVFGSIDINRGDPQNGWDTDQFNNDCKEMTLILTHILMDGGFKSGGFNFDAKLRRQSIDIEDLFIAHIGGLDVLAKALINASNVIEDKFLDQDYLSIRFKIESEELINLGFSGSILDDYQIDNITGSYVYLDNTNPLPCGIEYIISEDNIILINNYTLTDNNPCFENNFSINNNTTLFIDFNFKTVFCRICLTRKNFDISIIYLK